MKVLLVVILAQVLHCHPGVFPGMAECKQDKDVGLPAAVLEQNRKACLNALGEDAEAGKQLLDANNNGQFLSVNSKPAYEAKRRTQRKIEKFCKP